MFPHVYRTYCFCCKIVTNEEFDINCKEAYDENILIRSTLVDYCPGCIQRNCDKHINHFKFGWYRCNDIQILPILYEFYDDFRIKGG